MQSILQFTLASLLAFTPLAHSHSESTSPANDFGKPGSEAQVTKTIHIEALDSMRFVSAEPLAIHVGDTVKFIVHNAGKLRHEFTLGDVESQHEHGRMMRAMPDMQHNDANSLSLASGETKSLIWTFTQVPNKPLELGCNLPGHYEAGMKQGLPISQP